jgi:hypothetical protein
MVRRAITLITYPTVTDFTELESTRWTRPLSYIPPMGVLLVASLFRQHGYEVDLVDTNKEYLDHLESGGDLETFCDALGESLAMRPSELFGFSSICSSYYVTLDLAQK